MRGVGEGRVWLFVALCAGAAVAVAYVATHAHPAHEGGLFLIIVEEIRTGGYALPERIPHYTADGVPFAYPPLLFYLVALFVDLTGVDPVALALVLPSLVTVACLVPYYALSRELLSSPRAAGVATLLFAVTPAALRWHISAGGLIRAPAFLFTLCGLYAGVRLLRDGERRWLPPAAVLFGLTVLTHPVYATFFGTSYLVLFAAFDRTPRGLLRGAAVAVGGLALASPWLVRVVSTHGPGVFFAAAGTHTGLGGGLRRLGTRFGYPLVALDVLTPLYAVAFAGGLYALYRRRYVLPIWLFVAGYVVGRQRFVFVPGAMLSAVFLLDWFAPTVRTRVRSARVGSSRFRRIAPTVAVATLLLGACVIGVAFAGSALHTAHDRGPTQPQTVDAADREAMAWAREETPHSAGFVVLGDGAEWFPLYAERTIFASPWGAEWTTAAEYHRQESRFVSASTCRNAACLDRSLDAVDGDPVYVYVPTDAYTVQGEAHEPPRALLASLRATERYELRFENEGAAIFEIRDGRESGKSAGA
ncbi:glycosyltransferase family 39 protein [Halegenticoccus tardaugens]|uniref:glycosyltransferase family 39 protein n=1 Tax=Halegenticoccus tardaugens TaxID=2071624 RepID=UPI0013E99D02|nr:glycosyltransferase family 39 protein [Halegenticoccus tardaugens]